MSVRLRLDEYQHELVTLVCAGCQHPRPVRLRCGKRSCPDCRGRDYDRLVRGYGNAVTEIRNPKLLTVTLQNAPELTTEVVTRLRVSLKALLSFLGPLVRGGIYAIEVENVGRGWHVHAHVVMDAAYIPQRMLSAQWRTITGDSFVVDIRRAWSPRDALKYILKYLTKEPKLLDELIPTYNTVLRGVRLIQPFGVMYRLWKIQVSRCPCPDCGGTVWSIVITSIAWSWEDPVDATGRARAPA
jgi:hypothetical protein